MPSRSSSSSKKEKKKKAEKKKVKNVLFVQNLSRNATNSVLEEIFGFFGKIVHIEIALDENNNNLSLQAAFIHYEDEGDADQANQYMHKAVIDGKIIKCERIGSESQKKYVDQIIADRLQKWQRNEQKRKEQAAQNFTRRQGTAPLKLNE